MNSHMHCRKFFAVANIGLAKLLCKPVTTSLPVAYLAIKKDVAKNVCPTESDSFDVFLDELISNKSEDWKCKSKQPKVRKHVCLTENYSSTKRILNAPQWNKISKESDTSPVINKNELFTAAKNGNHELVLKLLNDTRETSIFRIEDFKMLATTFLESDCLQGIIMIEQEARKMLNHCRPQFYEEQIICLKLRGENIKALNLCDKLYNNYPEIRREVRGYLSNVLIDIVENHSEASLVQGKELVERLSIEYEDFRPISSLWHACFLSEWFSDQQVASQLLVHVIKQKSIVTIERRMIAATYTALAQHRPQLVYGLLQDLLSCNVTNTHIAPVLRALFDYKCSQRDLKGCAAILQTSLQLHVSFTSQQHTRFLDLLCRKQKAGWLQNKDKEVAEASVKPKFPPPFQLKF